jgi:proteic killer suppression protein
LLGAKRRTTTRIKPTPGVKACGFTARRGLSAAPLGVKVLRALRGAQHGRILRLMIRSIRHKGLRRYYETGSTSGIQTAHAVRLRMQLTALDTAQTIQDMDIPGYRLHSLKGKLKERWSISVSGNWRLTFEFKDGDVYLLDYEDYH